LLTSEETILNGLLIIATKLIESGSVVPSHIHIDGEIVVSEAAYSELKYLTDSLLELAYE
jgi:hypothetical protein